jgi:hypothetical protein
MKVTLRNIPVLGSSLAKFDVVQILIYSSRYNGAPITVAARSKVSNVFAHSNTWIVGSNSTQGMDVCVRVYFVFVLSCV